MLGVLAILVLMVTTVAVWAKATAFNSEKVAGIVGEALAEPEVQTALADYITDAGLRGGRRRRRAESVLPDAAVTARAGDRRGRPDGGRPRGRPRCSPTPEVQNLLEEVVERAHARAMQLLEGDGLVDGITVVDGAVTVNLLPLVGRGLERLQ